MAITVKDIAQQLKALLPRGDLWAALIQPDTDFSDLLIALSAETFRVYSRTNDLLTEADTRSTYELLSRWEEQTGIQALPSATVNARQLELSIRERELLDDTPATIEATAIYAGFLNPKVTEFQAHTIDSGVDAPLCHPDWRFIIKLTVTPTEFVAFDVDSAVDEHLGVEPDIGYLETLIKQVKPAHTEIFFEYL